MENIYVVYDDFGRIQASFKDKKNAQNYADITMTGGFVSEIDSFENLDEIIMENPKKFIESANCKLRYFLKDNNITIGGFKSNKGYIGYHNFNFNELKEIVTDGPDKLANHICGFFDKDGNRYNVTKTDYHLFVKKYAEVTNKIKKIKKYIKIAESVTKEKNKTQEKTFEK